MPYRDLDKRCAHTGVVLHIFYTLWCSWYSALLQAGWYGIQIPARDFCFSQTVQMGSGAHLAILNGYQGPAGLKQLGHVDYLPLSSTEVLAGAGLVLHLHALMAWTTTLPYFTSSHFYWF
jgi:hypothetical protein